MKKVDKLNNLLKKLDEMYDINHGGCAFVASVLAKKFEKEGKNYQVCCNIGKCKLHPNENEKLKSIVCIKDRLKNIDCRLYCGWWTPIHFFVRSDGIDYNKWNTIEYEVLNLKSKDLLDIYNNGRWNEKFDKTKINEIKELILQC